VLEGPQKEDRCTAGAPRRTVGFELNSGEVDLCDDDLLFVLSFVSKNFYLLWVVLESFRKSREILQREEKVKERVSNNGSNGLFFVSINIFCMIEISIQSSVIPASVRWIAASFFVLPL